MDIAANENQASGKRFRILIVDDMEVARKILGSMLESYDMITDYASSGEECLEKYKENDYDMIFMDQVMPGGSPGTETMAQLKQEFEANGKPIPVICFTSNDTPKDQKAYKEAGFSAVLGKPAHPTRVKELLTEFLGDAFQTEET